MGQDVCLTLDGLIAANGDNYARISSLLGRNPAYIQQFIKRRVPRSLNERDRRILARYFNVCESMLGGPPVDSVGFRTGQPSPKVILVPVLTLTVPAKGGSCSEADPSKKWIAFGADWLNQLSARPNSLSIINVTDESMMPTFHPGDEALVDHDDGNAQLRDGIYVVRVDDVLSIKRLEVVRTDHRFVIRNDNPLYSDAIAPIRAEIVGRVIWAARRLG